MKNLLRILLITCLPGTILFCFSCTENSKSFIKEYNISTNDARDSFQSSIKSYSVLKLDNNLDAYFLSVSKFILTDSYLLIHDAFKQNIIIFDNSGKHINTISKQGRGPGEYNYITDFMFDEKTREITICDNDRLKKYSFTGKYISEQKLDSRIDKITRMRNGNLVIEKILPTDNPETNYQVRVLNEKFEVLNRRLPITVPNEQCALLGQSNRTSLNKDYAYFFSYSGDTIFHITENKIIPAYLLKYDRDVRITVFNSDRSSKPNPYRHLYYFEIKDKSLLLLIFNGINYCFILDHTTGQTKSFHTSIPFRCVYKNKLILVINSMILKQTIESIDPGKTKCENPSSLDDALKNYMDDFQTVIMVNLDL